MNRATKATPPGRHRAPSPEEERRADTDAWDAVPLDVRSALERALTGQGMPVEASEWTFQRSSILGWVAYRKAPVGAGADTLAISPECRYAWVAPGRPVEDVLTALSANSPLGRAQIEFLLSDHARFIRGDWNLHPIRDLGWLCTGRTRFREHYFLVSRTREVLKVDAMSAQQAEPALLSLVAPTEGR